MILVTTWPSFISLDNFVFMRKLLFLLPLIFFGYSFGQSTQEPKSDSISPKIFTICDFCDQDYFKNEIAHLLFVRDQRLADFTVLFRNIRTGSGGNEYTLEFAGRGPYEGINVLEKFNSTPNMSAGDIREGLLTALNRGSLHFSSKVH